MGNSQSSDTSLSHLLSLSKQDIDEESVYWESFFTWELPLHSLSAIASAFHSIYSEKPGNIRTGISVCAKKLGEQIARLDDDFSPDIFEKTIHSMVSFLFYAMPEIIMDAPGALRDGVGERLAKSVLTLLQRKVFSLVGKSTHWYESRKSESHLDEFRVMVVHVLLGLKLINVEFNVVPDFVTSVKLLMNKYFNAPSRKTLKLQRELIQGSLNLLIVTDNCSKLDFSDVLSNTFIEEDYQTFGLSLALVILKNAKEDPMIIENIRNGLSSILLNLIYTMPNSNNTHIVLFSLLYAFSFPSISIGLNNQNISFYSKFPIHRGTYADNLIELLSKVEQKHLKLISLIISTIIPHTRNLSYFSSITIINILKSSFIQKDIQTTRTIIKSIHYLINQSVRDNIPFIILLLKNFHLILDIKKEITDSEECEQIISFIKNINQELKQFGKKFTSVELENFFADPSCENFAIPVLNSPQIEFDFQAQFEQNVKSLVFQEIRNVLIC